MERVEIGVATSTSTALGVLILDPLLRSATRSDLVEAQRQSGPGDAPTPPGLAPKEQAFDAGKP